MQKPQIWIVRPLVTFPFGMRGGLSQAEKVNLRYFCVEDRLLFVQDIALYLLAFLV
jgi:hypothetical protein